MSTSESSKPTLSTLIYGLVLVGIFFIPFNSYEGISVFGEFAKESATIFFLLAFVMWLLSIFLKQKIHIPIKNPISFLLMLLLVWFLLATLFNYNHISNYYLKRTSGFTRFARQFGALLISCIFFLLTYYHVFRSRDKYRLFIIIRRIFFCSFIIVSLYAFLEIGIVKFNISFLKPILLLFNYFPFTEVYLDGQLQRVSAVTYEPPAFATYLLTISGWMFSYILTGKGLKRFIPGILVICFAFFSDSRAGFIILVVQALIFALYLIHKRKLQALFVKIGIAVMLVAVVATILKGERIYEYIESKVTSFDVKNDKHSISNRSRFGIQQALFDVFKENPVYGVGFGQQAYAAKSKYPHWATDNNWEFKVKYLNKNHLNFPPGYNIYLRILAETGIIGLFIFLLFLALILFESYQLIRKKDEESLVAMVILVSFIGFILNWLKVDSFREFGFWLVLALLMHMMKDNENSKLPYNSIIQENND